MTADLIIKNANVFMTYRQCFEKRDVAVAGEKMCIRDRPNTENEIKWCEHAIL